jgi:hypothetical protein
MAKYTNEEFNELTTPFESELPASQLPEKVEPKHSFGDVVSAAFKTENVVGSYFTFGLSDRFSDNPDYDPYTKLIKMGRSDLLQGAAIVDNDEELADYINRRDEMTRQHTILNESGWLGYATAFTAGVADPFILVPGGGAIKAATKLGSVAKSAVFTGGLGSVAAGGQEAALVSTQEDRAISNIGYAALAGTALGGVLGGAAGLLSKGSTNASEQIIKDVMATGELPTLKLEGGSALSPLRLGEASVEELEAQITKGKALEGLSGLNEGLAKQTSSILGKWARSPKINGLTSNYPKMRELTNRFFDTSEFRLGKDIAGVPRGEAVEDLIKVDMGRLELRSQELNSLYYDYIGVSGIGKGAKAAFKGKRKDTMSFQQFSEELDTALRNNDVHKIPQIEKAAKIIRGDMDKVLKDMQELKLLPDEIDLKGAESYFRRSYNIRTIQTNRPEFEQLLTTHFIGQGNPSDEAAKIAKISTDNILGRGNKTIELSSVSMDSITGAGALLKERVLDIPDNMLLKFLNKDAISNYAGYMAQSSGIVNLNKVLRNMGYDSLAALKKDIRNESDVIQEAIRDKLNKGNLTQAKADKLLIKEDANLKSTLNEVDTFAKLVTGRIGEPKNNLDKFLKNLRKYQTMRLLGGMAISAIVDAGTHVFKYGLPTVVKHGILPMVKSIRASKAAKDEYKHFNVGLELYNNEILRIMTDGDFNVLSGKTKLDTVMDSTVDIFGKMTLNTHWTYAGKRLAAQETSGSMFETIEKFVTTGKLKDKHRIKFNQLGLSKDDLPRVWEMFKQYGKRHKGSYIADFASWTDREIAEKFGRAVMKDVDATILSPGRGDIPAVFQSNQVLKTLFQFKSFTATAANKILLSGLQRRDANALMGMTIMMGLGGTSWAIKEAIGGRSIEDASTTKILTESISRSGVSSLMTDAAFALNPYSASSRYAGLNAQSYILGPSANQLSDTYVALNILRESAEGGEMSETDKNKLTRLLPFHNLFWLRMASKKVGNKGE